MQSISSPSIEIKESDSPLQELSISHSILSLIPYNLAIEYLTIPYNIDTKGRLEVMMVSPENPDTLQKLQLFTGKLLIPRKTNRDNLLKLISKHYGPISEKNPKEQKDSEKRFSINLSASTITIVNDIIHEAVRLRASDIHLEPFELQYPRCEPDPGQFQYQYDDLIYHLIVLPLKSEL